MYDLLTYLQIIACVASLAAWPKIMRSNYMRLFPVLLFVIAAGELFGECWAKMHGNNTWFYNAYDPLMLVLYFAILYFSMHGRNFKRFILYSGAAYMLFSSLTYYAYYEKKAFNEWMYISGIFILIVSIIRKIYELLEDPGNLDFLKRPFFYLLFFTLLFYTVTIPSFAMDEWMAASKMPRLTAIVNNADDFLNLLLYAAYTIVFLWIRSKGIY